MPVVFDEVVGTVENPAQPGAEQSRPATAQKPDERQIRSALRHTERREARLRAD